AVIPKFVIQFMNHESPVINGEGDYSRDFTYIDNVIQMNEKAMLTENPDATNQVYNTAVGDRTTIKDMAVLLRDFLSEYDPKIKTTDIKHGPVRPGDDPHSKASIENGQGVLGSQPS